MLFYLTSLACSLPRVFVLISWLDAPLHFVITHMMLWDMFIDHLFTLYAYHGLNTSSFVWSLVQFSTRCSYFHYGKVKGAFSHPHFFREIRLDHPIIFSLMELGLEVELKIYAYWWSTDLVIVCFSHLFYPGLLMEILWSHLQPSHSGHLYDSRVLIMYPDCGLPPQDHVIACCIVIF